MSKKYYACVYGGASDHIDEKIRNEIQTLGKVITDAGYSLVYGAGATGCMGAVARGVSENGGYVMGISPHFISRFEEIYDCDNTVMVDTMSERKMLMEKHADVFLIAPGGIGTMDELFQVLTLKYLERIFAPVVVINIDGFYDSLLKLIDDIVKLGAAKESLFDLFEVVNSVDDERIAEILKNVKKGC